MTSEQLFETYGADWANFEQLKLLTSHDGFWIEKARTKQLIGEPLKNLLRSYGLIRGKVGKSVFSEASGKRDEFGQIMATIFSRKLNGTLEQRFWACNKLWQEAQKKCRNQFGYEASSATSKLLWFYHPSSWVMYDSLNRKALSKTSDKTVKPANFAVIFWEYYNKQFSSYQFKETPICQCEYPYRLRMIEKMLWLYGNENCDLILSRYESGLGIINGNLVR